MDENNELKEIGEANCESSNDRYRVWVWALVVGNLIAIFVIWSIAHQTTDWNTWTNVIAVAALGLASFDVATISALTSREMFETMKAQQKIMDGQLGVMNQQYLASIMPAIVTVGCRLEQPIESHHPPIAHILYANHGSGIATDVRLAIGWGIPSEDGLRNINEGRWPRDNSLHSANTRGVLAPGSEPKHFATTPWVYKRGQLDELLAELRFFYVYGDIGYSDILGNRYMTQFCVVAKDITKVHLSYTGQPNRIIPVSAYNPET